MSGFKRRTIDETKPRVPYHVVALEQNKVVKVTVTVKEDAPSGYNVPDHVMDALAGMAYELKKKKGSIKIVIEVEKE